MHMHLSLGEDINLRNYINNLHKAAFSPCVSVDLKVLNVWLKTFVPYCGKHENEK